MPNSKTSTESDQKKLEKELAKQVKNSSYISIVNKFPIFSNKKVLSTFTKVGPYILPKLGEGRKGFKMSKISVDNSVYIGEVNKNYERDGFGCIVNQNGSVYEGYFSVGQYKGKGRLINSEGDVYEGNWHDSLLQGEGKLVIQNPYSVYTGMLEDGAANGAGQQEFHDGSVYKGEFVAGKRHGKGIYYLLDGCRYEGEFCRDKQYGHGTFFYNDGSFIEGTWDRGTIVGMGNKEWPDGKKYVGEFNNSKCEGKGTMNWPDGRVFEGYWLDDRPHGIGTETKKNGKKVVGSWRAGKLVKITSEHDAPADFKTRTDICENVRDLEEKVHEIRKRLNKNFNEKEYLKTLKNFNSITHNKDEEYKKQKIQRYNEKIEAKILVSAKNWAKGRKIERNSGFLQDCERLGRVLSEFADEIFMKFSKILKIRMKLSDFNYYEPDLKVEAGVKLVTEWVETDTGCVYRGEMLAHKPEGRGVLLSSEELYEGYFVKGKKQGLGRLLTKKSQYTGYWFKDEKSGFGTYTKKKDSVYSGEFEFGKESGFGILKAHNARYEGQWKLGKQHGKGILKYEDGRIYQGDFCEGIVKGYGSLIWPSGKSIIGYWDDGEIIGQSQKVYLLDEQIPRIGDDEKINDSVQSWKNIGEVFMEINNRGDISA